MYATLQRRRSLTAYGFLLVPILFFLGIRILPTLYAFAMSLFSSEGGGVTLANYREMFATDAFWKALVNTLWYVVITVPIQMGIGLVLALMIGRIRRFKGLYRLVFFLPYITSTVAVSWVWRLLYDRNMGVINEFLGWFHIPPQGFLHDPNQALVSVALVIIWQNFGFAMLIFMAGIEAIPKSLFEAARVDGAGPWRMFRRITLPLLNPTIVFLAVTGVISALQTFTQVANLTGGSSGEAGGPLNSTLSMVTYVYNAGFNNFNLQYASAVTVVLFVLILVVTLVQLRVLNRSFEY